MTGEIAFRGGALRMTPTPAMTLFDVDGQPPLEALSIAAATATARAILRHDIGGSIGIDFPTLEGKAARQAVAAAIDAGLPLPFERTAMNGFGFLQIVRRRARASLPELLRADPAGAAARALLRSIERTPPPVPGRHLVRRSVHARLAARPDWTDALARRTGTPMTSRWNDDGPDQALPDLRQAADAGAYAVLQPGLPRPRSAAMARRRLCHSRRAGRHDDKVGVDSAEDGE